MCGIFGYYNYHVVRSRKDILDCLLTGLRRLEYRGYDSAGLAIDIVPLGGESLTEIITDGTKSNGHVETSGEVDRAVPGTQPAGVSIAVAAVPPPIVIKSSGKIAELEKLSYLELSQKELDMGVMFETHVGIAHTRWATHGPPTPINAHPHVSGPEHEFVVVHNGIITNFRALKDSLKLHGETFITETDTEVIPKLCNYCYKLENPKPSLVQLVMGVMSQLEGAFALLVKSRYYPGELVACKRGSPLILGVRIDESRRHPTSPTSMSSWGMPRVEALECFLASDASAVVEHTKKVVVLEDSDLVHLKDGGYTVFNLADLSKSGADVASRQVSRALQTLEMEVSQIMKGGYDHFMQKEIHEQPDSITQTMRGRVRLALSPRRGAVDPYKESRIKLGGISPYVSTIRSGRRIMFVACGTSYHACLAARPTVEDLVELPVALELASDLLDRRCPIFRDDTCVFVSQSGETADTLQALEYAKRRGALCVGITNTVGSAIARSTQCGIHINAGAEIGVASTKAYTSQIVAITMMALALSEDSISKRELRDQIIDSLNELPSAIRIALLLDGRMRELAMQLKDEQSLLVFGRGYNFATALEAALKVKEVALMHSEGILAGEMKHGPLALVDDTMPIIVLATRDSMHAKMLSVIQQLRARGASLIVVCNDSDEELGELLAADCRCFAIPVPKVSDCLQPIVNIVPLQLLSYHLTVLRGHDVDQPRNLAKSVTVSEEEHKQPAGGLLR